MSASTSKTGAARQRRQLHFGYSTNVHRSETLPQIYDFLASYTLPVKKRVFGSRPGGLELRLGIGAAKDLSAQSERERFREHLESSGLEIFSINAFPLQDFQARHVKQEVYAPDWTRRERVRWTIRICEIFADLLPVGRPGSVSTLAGTYRFWSDSPATHQKIAANYLDVLWALEELEQRTGKSLVLAAEPEPDTTFEVARDVIEFFEETLLPAAREHWKSRVRSRQKIEEIVRRRFTVNFDTCHFSVLFHDPSRALRELDRAGLGIGKVHVTNALRLRRPARAKKGYATFRSMDEPRYLHQFCGADERGHSVWRGRDLDELPRTLDRKDIAELRTHFHVPLYLKRWRSLETTQDETESAVRTTLRHDLCRHLVFETYTWPVLTTEDRLLDGLTREYRWLLKAAGHNGDSGR